MINLNLLILILLSLSFEVYAHDLNYKCDNVNSTSFKNNNLFKRIFVQLNSKNKRAKLVLNNKKYFIDYQYNIPRISLSKIKVNSKLLKYGQICECKSDFSLTLEIDRLSSYGTMKLNVMNSEITFNKEIARQKNFKKCIDGNQQSKRWEYIFGTKEEKFDCNSEDILMPKEYKKDVFIDEKFCKRKCFKTQNVLLSCEKF